jgi:hypothetical protein
LPLRGMVLFTRSRVWELLPTCIRIGCLIRKWQTLVIEILAGVRKQFQ